MTDRLCAADELADVLNLPVSWVREKTRSGSIPHVRLGRYVRYEVAAVLEWLETCRRGGRPITLRRNGPAVAGSRGEA